MHVHKVICNLYIIIRFGQIKITLIRTTCKEQVHRITLRTRGKEQFYNPQSYFRDSLCSMGTLWGEGGQVQKAI